MTIFVPLDPSSGLPAQPTFLLQSGNVHAHLSRAIQAIMKAKRIVIICGAGISVQAGIPDFRSSDGLFRSIKRDNPREAMTSGKELFDASVFNSENKATLFYQMIAQLSDLSHAAEPTAFHNVLRALDNRGRLLRVYTQNIDAIEKKSGLSFGVPDFDCKRSKAKTKGRAGAAADAGGAAPDVISSTTRLPPNRLPSPPADTPRCIPLHGTLQSVHCQVCNHAFPISAYLPSLASGQPPPCPECTDLELARKLVGKRQRGIGRLRPSVVLYNEEHKDGEGVGEVVQRDLMGSKGKSGADLLLVVGTSLKVPGTKRMVREFAKAVKARAVSSPANKVETSNSAYSLRSSRSGGLFTPAASPRRTPTADEEVQLPKSIYLNLDFPVPTREWEGVFDMWVQGDAQLFAETLQAEIDREAKAKEIASERKRRKDEEAVASAVQDELPDLGRMRESEAMDPGGKRDGRNSPSKRKSGCEAERQVQHHSPSKRRKFVIEVQKPPPHTPTPTKGSAFRDSSFRYREKRLANPPIVEIPRLTIRLPPMNPQSNADDDVGSSSASSSWPRGLSRTTPMAAHHRFSSSSSSSPSPTSDGCKTGGRRAERADRRARRTTDSRQLAGGCPLGFAPPLSCHRENRLLPSGDHQFRDRGLGQDGVGVGVDGFDFDLEVEGRSMPHSAPALADIAVG